MWIDEHQNWPEFTWNIEKLASRLADIRYRQGRFLGRMEELGFDLRREAGLSTLTRDVVKSSAIEGENLDPREVRSSIARRLGISVAAGSTSRGIGDERKFATIGYNPLEEGAFTWRTENFGRASHCLGGC